MKIDIDKLRKRASISIDRSIDSTEIYGNASGFGDPEDRQVADRIEAELRDGNVWAWAQVEVKVEYAGYEHSEFLGGCSYESEQDFCESGYYEDMVWCGLAEIARQMEREMTAIELVSAESEAI